MIPYKFVTVGICVPMEANAQIIITRTNNTKNNQRMMNAVIKIWITLK